MIWASLEFILACVGLVTIIFKLKRIKDWVASRF